MAVLILETIMLSSLATTFAEANRYFNTELSAHFRAIDEGNLLPMLLIFVLSFGYGVVHAIGPGHGKALVAGYLLANPTKHSHVFQIGFFIAIVHALSALLVTLSATYIIQISAMKLFRQVNPPLFQISGGLIVLMGCWLLFDVWRSRTITKESIRPHNSRFGVVLLAGVVPCPGVITLCFFAITLGHIGIGIIAAVFMSLGMGLTISLAGLVVNRFQKVRPIVKHPRWFWVLRLVGVLCVIALGVWFLANPMSTRAF
ncbi:nickel/cobalt transporter [Sulfurospirillum multivorans]|uniref:Nickel/cobalt efflux system n=2 Tax=Sulfurospirillum multivorans TaxID=66821 RepID=A0AA86AQS9_SULMK|nr:high frequency lysogenization protein HflD [Sulfurospirillum multivorans]AHJ14021.1 NiCoT family (subfamily 2) transporter [Sulfurospirillum multivorans DSM 12446]QEH07508.1 NiCoT family (subfamily 2) transporter [Sulfurospirillum multivorans]